MDKEAFCFFCGEKITKENYTLEHIIPNSIGGRKKVGNFICKKCNNELGRKWDNELAKQLKPICFFLGIKRERNQITNIILTDENGFQYIIYNNHAIRLKHPQKKVSNNVMRIVASDKNELIKILNNKNFCGDYELEYDIKDMQLIDGGNKFYDVPLRVGKENFFKSLAKTCLALAFYNSFFFDASFIKKFFNDEILINKIGGYWYQAKTKILDDESSFIHCIHINASQKEQMVIGYIEYFSAYKFIIILSNNYLGKDCSYTYAYDPIKLKEIDVQVSINYDRKLFQKVQRLVVDYPSLIKELEQIMFYYQVRSAAELSFEEVTKDNSIPDENKFEAFLVCIQNKLIDYFSYRDKQSEEE